MKGVERYRTREASAKSIHRICMERHGREDKARAFSAQLFTMYSYSEAYSRRQETLYCIILCLGSHLKIPSLLRNAQASRSGQLI